MTEMLAISPAAIGRFFAVSEMSAHREDLPVSAWFAAKLAATLAEDCGPCTQLVAQMAEEQGLSAATVRAIVEGDVARMGDDAALGWRFTRAVLAHVPEADALREQVVSRWGQRAMVTLALAIAASRMYPTVKYAMGHGRSCQRIRVGGSDVTPAATAGPA
jgi:hypothetical protein